MASVNSSLKPETSQRLTVMRSSAPCVTRQAWPVCDPHSATAAPTSRWCAIWRSDCARPACGCGSTSGTSGLATTSPSSSSSQTRQSTSRVKSPSQNCARRRLSGEFGLPWRGELDLLIGWPKLHLQASPLSESFPCLNLAAQPELRLIHGGHRSFRDNACMAQLKKINLHLIPLASSLRCCLVVCKSGTPACCAGC